MKKDYKWTDPKTQTAIVADASAGLTVRDIAQKYGVSVPTVSRVIRRFKIAEPRAELASGIADGYRERLRDKSIAAIQDGLDDQSDAYKRATLGVRVMEGIGEFGQRLQVEGAAHLTVSWLPATSGAAVETDDAITVDSEILPESVR